MRYAARRLLMSKNSASLIPGCTGLMWSTLLRNPGGLRPPGSAKGRDAGQADGCAPSSAGCCTARRHEALHHRLRLAARCDAVAVLRSVTLGLALSVLAADCALVGRRHRQGPTWFRSRSVTSGQSRCRSRFTSVAGPAEPQGQPPSAQPPSVPAGPSRTAVTFYLPLAGDWEAAIGDIGGINGQGFDPTFRRECPLVIDIPATGEWRFGCAALPSFIGPSDGVPSRVPPGTRCDPAAPG